MGTASAKKDRILRITILVTLILVTGILIFATLSYAYWQKEYNQEKENTLQSGCFSYKFTDENSINLENAYPMSESEAMKLTPYTFTIENNCSIDMFYNVTLNTTGTSDLDSSLRYKLLNADDVIGTDIISNLKTYNEYNNFTYADDSGDYNIINSYILDKGTLTAATMNDDNTEVVEAGESITYNLYLWVDENVDNIEIMAKSFEGKIIVTSKVKEQGLLCRKATELHTEECTQTDETSFCSGAGYVEGDKDTLITYGKIFDGELKAGDAFDCDVNGDNLYDSKTERFYYVSDYYDTQTNEFNSNYAVLIYYSNMYVDNDVVIPDKTSLSLVAYDTINTFEEYTANWYGPVTILNNLPKYNIWKNTSLYKSSRKISNELEEYTTSNGNQNIVETFNYENVSARLLTLKELSKSCEFVINERAVGELDECTFLFENSKFSNASNRPYGFWLENPASNSPFSVNVIHQGNRSVWGTLANNAGTYGLRPVIEVEKVYMELD